MRSYRLGPKAISGLTEILDYTVDTWGETQAENNASELEKCFQFLTDSPGAGRSCEQLAPEVRRFEQQAHVIFYQPRRDGILIYRILHRSRLPSRADFLEA